MRNDPQDAPRTVKAADGVTTLHRFEVEGVIYAPSRAEAEKRLQGTDTVLDRARIMPRTETAEWSTP